MSDTSGMASSQEGVHRLRNGQNQGGSTEIGTAKSTPVAALQGSVESTGSFVKFVLRVLQGLPVAARLYPAEIFRHAGLLIRANSAVVLFMCFMLGTLLGLTTHFIYTNIGIESYIATVNAVGAMRGILQVVFGWIIAAKVGCGIVAELGAMKISDEVDAMEVMGIRSIPYLAGTRLMAGLIVVPFLWIASLSINFIGGYLINELLNTASQGAFIYFLFLFQNSWDFVFALIWGTLVGLIIVVVASYYGFTAKGGPVGVGRNTAQSMLVNLVLISMTAMILMQLFYGNNPNSPIGN